MRPCGNRLIRLIAAGGIAAGLCSGAAVPARSQDGAGKGAERAPAPSLPSGGESRIHVRRDAEGNLVPYEPEQPVEPTAAERAATTAMPNHGVSSIIFTIGVVTFFISSAIFG